MVITPALLIYSYQKKYQPFNNVPSNEVMWKPTKNDYHFTNKDYVKTVVKG